MKRRGAFSKKMKIIISLEIVIILLIAVCFYAAMNISVDKVMANEEIVTQINHPFTILIDAGHGGYDPGAVNEKYNILEKDLNLEYAFLVGDYLEKRGVKVLYTRETDYVPWEDQITSLKRRVEIEHFLKPDIFLSIHLNSAYKPDSNGFEVWCTTENSESEKLGSYISNELEKIQYAFDRGLKYKDDNDLYVVNRVNSTGVLVELGFMSNYEDLAYLQSDIGKNACSKAVGDAVQGRCV